MQALQRLRACDPELVHICPEMTCFELFGYSRLKNAGILAVCTNGHFDGIRTAVLACTCVRNAGRQNTGIQVDIPGCGDVGVGRPPAKKAAPVITQSEGSRKGEGLEEGAFYQARGSRRPDLSSIIFRGHAENAADLCPVCCFECRGGQSVRRRESKADLGAYHHGGRASVCACACVQFG